MSDIKGLIHKYEELQKLINSLWADRENLQLEIKNLTGEIKDLEEFINSCLTYRG